MMIWAVGGATVVWAASDLGTIGGIPIGQLTPAGLLFIIILLIASGRLVPRRTMEDVIHDRNEWRTAHRISEQSRAEQNEMVKELLEHARTTDAFIRSVSTAAQQYRGGEGADQSPEGG